MSVNLKSLIGKLNDTTRNTLQAAAGFCLQRTHYDVEIEHFLMKLLEHSGGDFAAIIKAFDIDKAKLSAQLTASLDKIKSGNARTPVLAPTLVKMLEEAWSTASLDFDNGNVRTGYCIIALTQNEELTRLINDVAKEFKKIDPKSLKDNFSGICGASYEESEMTELGEGGSTASTSEPGPDGTPKVNPASKQPNLDAYTINLTENAKLGKIDTVLARDFEIRQVVDILTRRRQNIAAPLRTLSTRRRRSPTEGAR